MAIEFQLQLAWSQLGNATGFSTHPYLSVIREQTVHKVTAQWIHRTVTIPMLNIPSLIIYDIHTTESSHQKFIIWRDGKVRHYFVLERMVGSRAMEFLLATIKQSAIRTHPYLAMI